MTRARLKVHRLREIITRSNLSQNHWAIRLELARGHFSDLLNGNVPCPSPRTRQKLLSGLGVEFDELFEVVSDNADDRAVDRLLWKTLADRYVVDRTVGEGRTGTVYSARELRYGRHVAIKVVTGLDGDGIREFERRVSAMARLQHPHITPVLDSGEGQGFAYVVTPLAEEGSLRDYLEAEGAMTVRRLIPIVEQVASALELAHEKGLIHGDVKPENILLRRDVAQLTDFGIVAGPGEASGDRGRRRTHTAPYRSPERVRDDGTADHRTDQYSLASVIFEMLTGVPYVTEDLAVRSGTESASGSGALRTVRPDLPAAFERVLLRALSQDPHSRFDSISKFLAALRIALREEHRFTVARTHLPHQWTTGWQKMGISSDRIARRINALLDSTRTSIRHAVRGLKRSPAFSFGVALTLSLGVGVNVVMFGALDRIFLSAPDHIAEPQNVKRIYAERELGPSRRVTSVNYADTYDLKDLEGVTAVAAYTGPRRMTTGENRQVVRTQVVSREFFPLLGTVPFMGGFFGSIDGPPVEDAVVVLSHGFWRRHFGGDEDILGQNLELNRSTYTIVGVAPPGFSGIDIQTVDAWIPMDAVGNTLFRPGWETTRGAYFSSGIVRLAADADMSRISEMATAVHRAARADLSWYPAETADILLGSVIAARGPDRDQGASISIWLAGVALAVLLIASSNVASLFLSRHEKRQREIAVRLALGISRRRLIVLLIGEGAFLGTLSCVLAYVAALAAGGVLYSYLLPSLDPGAGVLTGKTLMFMAAIAIGAGVAATLGPALIASRADVVAGLKAGSARSGYSNSRVQSALVIAQVAMSMILLFGAGLFIRSSMNVSGLDLGFDTDGLIVALIASDTRSTSANGDETPFSVAPYLDAVERVTNLPGVTSAGFSTLVPFYSLFTAELTIPSRQEQLDSLSQGVYVNPVDDGYFRTAGISTLRGRTFLPSDNQTNPLVAIINEELATLVWGNEDPLGECLNVDSDTCTEVVGIVEDARQSSLTGPPTLLVYLPAIQRPDRVAGPVNFGFPPAILVRTTNDMESTVRAQLRPVMDAVLPEGQYVLPKTFDDLLESRTQSWRMGSTIFSLFGGLALLVAAVGLYSLLTYRVSRRRHELGVRAALGASARHQIALLTSESLTLTGLGVVSGLIGAILLAPKLEDLLFGVGSRDAQVGAAVVLLFVVIGLAATVIPAARAARSDPQLALRAD